VKKLYLKKYKENEFLEILTYLYEWPKSEFGRKYNIVYPQYFKKYKSFFNQKIPQGKYIYDYMDFGKTLAKQGLRKIQQLVDGTNFDDEFKPKIESYLYKKISITDFSKLDLSTTIHLEKMDKNQFENLPEKITDINQLPNNKIHEEFLEKNFKKIHEYRNIRIKYETSTVLERIYIGAVYGPNEKKIYISDIEKNNRIYPKYLKQYSQYKELFEKNKENDSKKFKNILDDYSQGNNEGIFTYLNFILSQCVFNIKVKPKNIKLGYESEEKRLIVELQLPDFDRITIKEYRIKKDRTLQEDDYGNPLDKIISKSEHNKIAENILYLIPIRIIYEFFYFDFNHYFKHIALNGIVASYNKATGKIEKNNVLSLFVERQKVLKLNLNKINPKECFRGLKGISASKIYENVPINPILTFKKDKRIIKSKPILDNLKEENLAVMPWDEFEHLIRELFAKEFGKDGEEVKITQSSRDRGVDAIAYDPDPIRGGKYIIQAKRYTATVDVAAVRDLYGTIHNEGANRGILVTTAKYGSDAYNFAKDKNISLINGSELLGLLNKHGYNNFKIDIMEARKTLNLTPKKPY
jgi:restriction system protein|tara:strand:+ start:595 stop:2334 length:1740 start_codon:yes stop_codon:yes gene_type:complete